MIHKSVTRKFYVKVCAFCAIVLCPVNLIHTEEKPLLETLWNEALHNNVDLKAYETEVSSAAIKRKFHSTAYAPAFVVKGSNAFASTIEREKGTQFDETTGTLVYTQPFLGGANLATSLSYSLARPWTSNDTYALQTPAINFSLTQGLLPWWAQGLKADPEVTLLDNTVSGKEIQLVKQQKHTLISLTQNFISLRATERSVALLKNTMSLRDESISSLKKLLEMGAVSMTKLWEEQQQYMDDANSLVQNRNEIARLGEEIRITCGVVAERSDETVLPDLHTASAVGLERAEKTNLEYRELEMQSIAIGLGRAQRLQNTAPSINLSADFSWAFDSKKLDEWKEAWTSAWEDKKAPRYTISMSVDISPLFSEAGKRDRQLEDNNLKTIDAQKRAAIAAEQNQKNLLRIKLDGLTTQIDQYRTTVQQTAMLVADAETLARQGAITPLELQTYRNQLQKRQVALANAEDQAWYVAWFLEWWME